jgi:hypothetical protein
MKLVAASLGIVFALSTMATMGCSHPSRAKTPDELFASMELEASQALDHGLTDGADAVSATTLTSATLPESGELPPMPLPEDRMSLSGLNRPATATWGVPSPTVDGIPATREGE